MTEQKDPSIPAEKPATRKKAAAGGVTFRSTEKESSLWDVMIAGNTIRGTWDAAHERVVWIVPAELADRMEQHIQVLQKRIARA